MRLVVTYRRPQDRAAFDRDYFGVHVPLAQKLPGLQRYVVSRAHPDTTRATDDAYLIATLEFDSPAALDSARILLWTALNASPLICRAMSIAVAPGERVR